MIEPQFGGWLAVESTSNSPICDGSRVLKSITLSTFVLYYWLLILLVHASMIVSGESRKDILVLIFPGIL